MLRGKYSPIHVTLNGEHWWSNGVGRVWVAMGHHLLGGG